MRGMGGQKAPVVKGAVCKRKNNKTSSETLSVKKQKNPSADPAISDGDS